MSITRHIRTLCLCLLLLAIGFPIPFLQAQTGSPDSGHWPTCNGDWIDHDRTTGPNFTVRVSFRGAPIVGTRVVLTDAVESVQNNSAVIASHKTDSDGIAHFSGIPRGTYMAHLDQALLAPGEDVYVEANDNSSSEFQIEWPEAPIVARSVQGWIRSWQKSSPQNRSELRPHANVLIQLLDLRSGKRLASMHTNADGYYEFFTAKDGLYILRIGEHSDPSIDSYDQAVDVASDATLEHVPDLEVDEVCGRGLVRLEDPSDREKSPVLLTQK